VLQGEAIQITRHGKPVAKLVPINQKIVRCHDQGTNFRAAKVVLIVLDCSAVLAMCFEDEGVELAENLFDYFVGDSAVAPAIWPLEVSNALSSAVKRNRIAKAESIHLFHLISALPVDVQQAGIALESYEPVFELAENVSLCAHDASYLHLAMSLGLPLATLDTNLIRAAREMGTQIFGENEPRR
jgi:predicted nucleic acid-binding protein